MQWLCQQPLPPRAAAVLPRLRRAAAGHLRAGLGRGRIRISGPHRPQVCITPFCRDILVSNASIIKRLGGSLRVLVWFSERVRPQLYTCRAVLLLYLW
jgi:hypothetical protein